MPSPLGRLLAPALVLALSTVPLVAQTNSRDPSGLLIESTPESPVGEAPLSRGEAAERVAPQTKLDWQDLKQLDAADYLTRLVALDAIATQAAELAHARAPRPRTTEVADRILEAHETGRAVAREVLPERVPTSAEAYPEEIEMLARLRAEQDQVAFEEVFVDAMIEAHREAVGLSSFYRRFGEDQEVREFARRIQPLIEYALYQAVSIRQELAAEFLASGREPPGG